MTDKLPTPEDIAALREVADARPEQVADAVRPFAIAITEEVTERALFLGEQTAGADWFNLTEEQRMLIQVGVNLGQTATLALIVERGWIKFPG